MTFWNRIKAWWNPNPTVTPETPRRSKEKGFARALTLASAVNLKRYNYPIQAPVLIGGVIPRGMATTSHVLAQDSATATYGYAQSAYGDGSSIGYAGFAGYPYLASLATRAEYRAFASAICTEMTREWISLNSTDTGDDKTKQRITELECKIKEIGLQNVIRKVFEHDSLNGRGQIYLELRGQDPNLPLILSPKTIAKNSFVRISNIEAMWTTPAAYNALKPWEPDFYKPSRWFVLGTQVHSSRLLTVITREVPDMLKPAFNFGGISLSQLAEPYVDNWLRTRQSVSDLIANFSVTALKTSMDQMLNAGDDDAGLAGDTLFKRADLFTALRSNKGLMLLDKEAEDLVQLNTPLSGLDALQAQSQEQLCSVTHIPAIILTGISPSGLNASSEGELKCWEDFIHALQEAFARTPIETILKVLQLSMWGEIDSNIHVSFNPLRQMTKKELSDIRLADANAAAVYLDRGVISPEEDRERLARDSESGYQGLGMGIEIEQEDREEDDDEE